MTTTTTTTVSALVSSDVISAHIDSVQAKRREIFTYFVENIFEGMVIDDTCSMDNRVLIGDVSTQLGEVFDTHKLEMQSILSYLIEGFPGLVKKMGPMGGLYRVSYAYVVPAPEKKTEDTAKKVEKLQKQLAKQQAKLEKLKG